MKYKAKVKETQNKDALERFSKVKSWLLKITYRINF